jgi:hypothetical protein
MTAFSFCAAASDDWSNGSFGPLASSSQAEIDQNSVPYPRSAPSPFQTFE